LDEILLKNITHNCYTYGGVKVKWFYVLLNIEADRTLLHSPLDMVQRSHSYVNGMSHTYAANQLY